PARGPGPLTPRGARPRPQTCPRLPFRPPLSVVLGPRKRSGVDRSALPARANALPAHRLAAFDRLVVREVVYEERRHSSRSRTELRCILLVIVTVRLRRVPAVTARCECMACFDRITRAHLDGSALQMREPRVLPVAVIDDDVVARGCRRCHLAGRVVGQRIDGNGDPARGGSEYRSAEAVVVLVPRAVTGVGACIAGDDQVVGEALVRIHDVVVLV